jgi:glutathione synthase/RimK-type ligase-like ATP-grasp enzyme
MRIRIHAYNAGSRSARALAGALNGRVLRREGSRFVPQRGDVVITWGGGGCPHVGRCRTFNGAGLDTATNKLSCFNILRAANVSVPPFWTNQRDIPDDAFPVVCRTVLNGHSGAGIVIANERRELVNAPLYVQYKKKQDEYRIHVMQGEVISVQRKALRQGEGRPADPDFRVRNLANGFVFVRGDVNPPREVLNQSIMALNAVGIDFGAVDVIWNSREERAYVLEINTAPGLEGQTVEDYANAFRRVIGRG